MEDDKLYFENIKNSAIKRIEQIITEKNAAAKRKKLNPVETYGTINTAVKNWIEKAKGTIVFDDDMVIAVAELKQPLYRRAKEDIAEEMAKIVRENDVDITNKIAEYINNLNMIGIDLNEDVRRRLTSKEREIERVLTRSGC